ncbi:MAG: DUF805 domain-containing protein [Gammaproteobacteria bacterium]|jgi:uncharacterized membrane protein YhaH (DUF805 family)|nr:DUF805 domain-containing protein [Gammaproteobacteria bacterium]MBT5681861.1 DUF805 domain-containing protein [Gammaproteobacteria bacterium]MBT6025496.1 DUF805 domain-containing protein [Gammaproteobacteria bacterium]|tara:strand:- start:309 stop:632 length:324 start_codon:yes stop_codon:yes gene_type:complete
MDNFINTLKSYSDFASRTGRNDYWMFMLFYVVLSVATGIVDSILGILLVNSIYSLVMLVPLVAATTRRLHDTGRSGLWQLLVFIPVLGLLVLIWFLAQESDGENEFS